MEERSRRLCGLVLASCLGHLIVGLGATLVTGMRAWPVLRLEHELALPAVSVALLVLAAFVVQGSTALQVVRGRQRGAWIIGGAFIPVAALGFPLAFGALRSAGAAASLVPPLAQQLAYVREAGTAVNIVLSVSTTCCLLASNAAVLFGVIGLARVDRGGRGTSARVAVCSGLAALAFVGVVQVTWHPMRWSSLPAGWLPAFSGLVASILAAHALSGHHVAEDTLRASLPPGKSRSQRMRHVESGRIVGARLSDLQSVLLAVVCAAVASAVLSGIVTEVAAFRGMLLAAGDVELAADTRVTRILMALEYLGVPISVHVVHALPALASAFAVAAMLPSRWLAATRRSAPAVVASLGGAILVVSATRYLSLMASEQVERFGVGYAEGVERTLLDIRRPLPRPRGPLVVLDGDSIRADGRVLPFREHESSEACQRVARNLQQVLGRATATYAVSPEVPYRKLRCLATALSQESSEIRWLVAPSAASSVPPPWRRLAVPLGAVSTQLWRGETRRPSLRLEAAQWVLTIADTESPRILRGTVEQRLGELRGLAPKTRRVDVDADGELGSDIVLRVLAHLSTTTTVALQVSERRDG